MLICDNLKITVHSFKTLLKYLNREWVTFDQMIDHVYYMALLIANTDATFEKITSFLKLMTLINPFTMFLSNIIV